MKPYFTTEHVALYWGDMRTVLPALNLTAGLICTDPPYGETSLAWDRWVDGWPTLVAPVASSMWCFGSFRMFQDHRDEFRDGWTYSHEIVWEKNAGSGFANDRFKRTHEFAVHWYRGSWADVYKAPPREPHRGPNTSRYVHNRQQGDSRATHTGEIGANRYADDGARLVRTVLRAPQVRGGGPTQKPVKILAQLIEYACPPGGLVVDCFAGRGSTGVAAAQTGRRAVLIEADERECEAIVRRLAQGVLAL